MYEYGDAPEWNAHEIQEYIRKEDNLSFSDLPWTTSENVYGQSHLAPTRKNAKWSPMDNHM